MADNSEVYVEWFPGGDSSERFSLEYISDTRKGLQICIHPTSDASKLLTLDFNINDIVGYKVANDSYTWRSESNRLRNKEHSLFKVENSNYINWFKEETYDSVDLSSALHYCLLLGEESIDIVVLNAPSVTTQT
ncbi:MULTISPECIES: hypothetical protein [Pseudomonas]|jgi:hypothetical protein|uniref:hypothetical protein n=1 Tax=Pseudomonas TaxID=286 RepID=UPI000F523F8D|nr:MULTISPECIES: hypothetical protein [Pseudomonas]MCS7834828.1 hypothetical protein [Pseudomonas aeruginosa]TEC20835.1 hypothetical protein IPC1595_31680 [Pseudomonas aeruginosa]WVK94806.1 hypothetical protein SA496_06350 [Pseudomonas sp. JS3066]HBO1343770.1 hypothetical protein [Pseudomonas aeruginosa]HBO1588658.1 hypothetical protein [Pseudomonas aeruginosa]